MVETSTSRYVKFRIQLKEKDSWSLDIKVKVMSAVPGQTLMGFLTLCALWNLNKDLFVNFGIIISSLETGLRKLQSHEDNLID